MLMFIPEFHYVHFINPGFINHKWLYNIWFATIFLTGICYPRRLAPVQPTDLPAARPGWCNRMWSKRINIWECRFMRADKLLG